MSIAGNLFRDVEETEKVGHGDHWRIFSSDTKELFKSILPAYFEKGQLVGGTNVNSVPAECIETDPLGVILCWPDCQKGIMGVSEVRQAEKALRFATAFPFFADGISHEFILEGIQLWPNHLEAWLEVSFADMVDITFFDTMFAQNRYKYCKGTKYNFKMSAMAYHFVTVEAKQMIIDNPETISILHRRFEDLEDRLSTESVTVETQGMSALFDLEGRAPDNYSFRGPLKELVECPEKVFDNKIWRAVVTAVCPDGNELDLPIYITEEVLRGQPVPKVGEDCGGTFWLQGYLAEEGATS